jgi:hypothetical protein
MISHSRDLMFRDSLPGSATAYADPLCHGAKPEHGRDRRRLPGPMVRRRAAPTCCRAAAGSQKHLDNAGQGLITTHLRKVVPIRIAFGHRQISQTRIADDTGWPLCFEKDYSLGRVLFLSSDGIRTRKCVRRHGCLFKVRLLRAKQCTLPEAEFSCRKGRVNYGARSIHPGR